VSTGRLLWTGSACLLLAAVLAMAAFALQVAVILASVGLGLIINAPVAATGGNNFVQTEAPRVLAWWAVQPAVSLPLVAGLLCFAAVLRRRFIRYQVPGAGLPAGRT
jgi:hypothetical protein